MAFSFSRLLLSETERQVCDRGLEYFNKKCVQIEKMTNASCVALVRGSKGYQIKLGFSRMGKPRGSCTCPYYETHKIPCKHIIAASITWDAVRGVPVPDEDTIEALTIPSPTIRYADITRAFRNPLQADLEVIRRAADELGRWSRPHARLPLCPKISADSSKPLTLKEFSVACESVRGWADRRGYDLYFCAGEMVAGFCELLRVTKARLAATLPVVATMILIEAQQFQYELIQELIDDSDGLHEFTEAHLEDLHQGISKMECLGKDKPRFYTMLRKYIAHQDDW